MTAETVRQELADAVSTIDGITCFPNYKDGKPGTAYVEFLRTEYPPVHGVLGGEDYWGIVVVLPDDLAAAQQFMDTHRGPLRQALMPAAGPKWLIVTQIRPALVALPDNPSTKTMVVEGHRAEE
ncbi:MAG TPA: hypothetical protein VIQ30_11025 [Pseudonocardia sp.]